MQVWSCELNVLMTFEFFKALLERTGYTLDVTTGQRKYGGPPPDSVYSGQQPSVGTEVKKLKTCTFCHKCTGVWFPKGTLHGFYFIFNLQIFVGKIPRDLFEDELVPLFEKAGPIWDLRLMMDPLTGLNRGYAFVTFCAKEAAQEAVKLVSWFFFPLQSSHAVSLKPFFFPDCLSFTFSVYTL